jgi:hypothetical protein
MGARLGAVAQILFLLVVIGYGTFELFRGNFAVMLATAPFLVIYYFFMITRRRDN